MFDNDKKNFKLVSDSICLPDDEPCIKLIDLEEQGTGGGSGENTFIEPNTCVGAQSINLDFKDLYEIKKNEIFCSEIENEADRYDDASDTKDISFDPTLHLIGVYQLSSYSGKTGSGQLLNTFHLLPGEESTITVTAYSKVTTENIETRSIVDSYSSATQNEFFSEMRKQETALNYREETSVASGSVGGGLDGLLGTFVAEVDAEASYGKTIHKEQTTFQDMFSKTVKKHSNRASSSRNIQIGTTSKKAQEDVNIQSVQRILKNPNINRTLTYQFKQAIQEYICVLHLIDMKIGYKYKKSGKQAVLEQYPLEKLDVLLKNKIKEEYRGKIKERILTKLLFINALDAPKLDMVNIKGPEYELEPKKQCLYNIIRVNDAGKEIVTPGPYRGGEIPPDEFIRFKKELKTINFNDKQTDNQPTIPGFIVDVTSQRLRTDSIVIDPEVGNIDALDKNGKNLQNQEVWSKYLQNRRELGLIRREQLAQDIVERYKNATNDTDRNNARKVRFEADVFNKLYFDQRLDPFPNDPSED
ncbi:hypothetical protein [Bacillus cereus]|uniref:hypothetical protein n=1 Tax=Bacillus cereus TaxID=1396 RepID=UPI004039E925